MLAGQSLERINSDNSRTPPPVGYALASVCRRADKEHPACHPNSPMIGMERTRRRGQTPLRGSREKEAGFSRP
jgi:hypothetical protein